MKVFGGRIRRVEDVNLVVVTMAFDATDPGTLQALLAKYVVLTR